MSAALLDNLLGVKGVRDGGATVTQRSELDLYGAVTVEDDPITRRTKITVGGVVGVTVANLFTRQGVTAGEPIIAKQYDTGHSGGGGLFYWDPASALDHDGGLVVGTVGTGRWVRVYAGAINVQWFGAKGDDAYASENTALQAALDAVPSGGELYIPEGTYRVTAPLERTASIRITGAGNSTLKRHGGWITPMLKIHGEDTDTRIGFVTVEGVSFNGTDSGSVASPYDGSNGCDELKIYWVENALVQRCFFSHTRARSLALIECTDAQVTRCAFLDGALSNGSDSTTTAFYIAAHYCDSIAIDDCKAQSDHSYTTGTQVTAMGAPTYVVTTNCEDVKVSNLKGYNTGNIEVYEACRNVTLVNNTLRLCHLPPLKVSNAQRVVIKGNILEGPLHDWGYGILVSAYTRVITYGCLSPNQSICQIEGNVVNGCKADYGAIYVQGEPYSTVNLDARIVYQAAHPGSLFPSGNNTVRKPANGVEVTVGPDEDVVTADGTQYFYKDFDGIEHGPLDQAYFTVRAADVSGNEIDGFATTGIRAYLVDTLKCNGNVLTNCGNLDTPTAFTKACFSLENVFKSSLSDNEATMAAGAVPTVSGVESTINGVVAWATTADFAGVSRLSMADNEFDLNEVASIVDIQDLKRFKCVDNGLGVQEFSSTGGAFIRARGICRRGDIGSNDYPLETASPAPATTTEYAALQSAFISLNYYDDRHGIDISRRVVNSAGDVTTPNQVASGYYTAGSTIIVSGERNRSHYRIDTAGWRAPAYDAGTAYTKGNKVKSAAGRYFIARSSFSAGAHTPPTSDATDDWWEFGGSIGADAVPVEYEVPPA